MMRNILFWFGAACAVAGVSRPAIAATWFVSPCGQDAWALDPVVRVEVQRQEFKRVTIVVEVGDINGDGIVDTADLGALIGDFGVCLVRCCPSDLNNDGVIDTADLEILISNFSAA